MPHSSQLSRRERQIMDVIYAHEEATAAQILAELPDPPTGGALRTLIRILESKGHLTHRQNGREFIYRPTQPRSRAARSALGGVLDVFFGGSLEKAVAAHLSDPGRGGKLSKEELQRLSELIEQAKQKGM